MSAQPSPADLYNRMYSRPHNTVDVWIDGIGSVRTRYDYEPGDPGCLVGPSDNWIEPSPDEIELIDFTIDGRPLSLIYDKTVEEIMEAIEREHKRHWLPKYRRRAPGPGGLYAGAF